MWPILVNAGLWLLRVLWPRRTAAEAERDGLKKTVERADAAAKARERVRRDPAERARVQRKYRRQ